MGKGSLPLKMSQSYGVHSMNTFRTPLSPPPPRHLRTLGGVFYCQFGRFEPKFVALSLIQSYLNHPYNGGKKKPKAMEWG